MTTIDYKCCKGKGIGHSYDYGMYINLKETLGHPLVWLIPIRFGIKGNGTDYMPTNLPDPQEEGDNIPQEEEKKGLLQDGIQFV